MWIQIFDGEAILFYTNTLTYLGLSLDGQAHFRDKVFAGLFISLMFYFFDRSSHRSHNLQEHYNSKQELIIMCT